MIVSSFHEAAGVPVGDAAPEVGDLLAAVVAAERGTDLGAVVEVRLEGVADALPARRRPTLGLGHVVPLLIVRAAAAAGPSRGSVPVTVAAPQPAPAEVGCRWRFRTAGPAGADQRQVGQRPMRSRRWCSVWNPGAAHPVERLLQRALERRRDGEVLDRTAARADQVVVVLGEVLGQLESGELVGGHEPVHDPATLEHGEVAVGRALGERRVVGEQLGDGEGPGGLVEQPHERPPARGVALPVGPEALGGRGVQVGSWSGPAPRTHPTGWSRSEND